MSYLFFVLYLMIVIIILTNLFIHFGFPQFTTTVLSKGKLKYKL